MFTPFSESTNQFVVIKYDPLSSSVHCTFKQQSSNDKSCRIAYGPGEQCTDLSQTSESRESTLNSVVIDHLVLPHLQNEGKFCAIVTASDGTSVVSVEKILNTGMTSTSIICIHMTACMMTLQAAIHNN